MKSTTGGQHQFAKIPTANIPRSAFNRSYGHKMTLEEAVLVPVFVDEALPGDTMNLNMSTLCRMATPLYPIMDNMYLDSFYFSVPMRLIWDNWAKFNGEQVDPDDSTDFTIPTIVAGGSGFGGEELFDYMGIPPTIANLEVNATFSRAYNLIYNEFFRDQNLIDSAVVDTDDGPDDPADYILRKRGKRHDYFTSCLPWPQKGTAVTLSMGGSAPVTITGTLDNQSAFAVTDDGGAPSFDVGTDTAIKFGSQAGVDEMFWDQNITGTDAAAKWNTTALETDIDGATLAGTGTADLSAATAQTINEIRQAFQIQKLYERDARGGSRLVEIIKSHFGVTSEDARMQRPEYLGGGSQPINVTPVAATNESANVDLGELAGYAVSSSSAHSFNKSFTEHCIVIGIISIRADLSYQQGVPRMFSRQTRWDYYWPALQAIGEQSILNKEIYAQNDANDDLVFGYQERHAEYRYKPSQISGGMRSGIGGSLDPWHLAQEFTSLPVLGKTFIEEAPPLNRVLAVPSASHFIFDSYSSFKHVRPMPTYGVPGMVDRF